MPNAIEFGTAEAVVAVAVLAWAVAATAWVLYAAWAGERAALRAVMQGFQRLLRDRGVAERRARAANAEVVPEHARAAE